MKEDLEQDLLSQIEEYREVRYWVKMALQLRGRPSTFQNLRNGISL